MQATHKNTNSLFSKLKPTRKRTSHPVADGRGGLQPPSWAEFVWSSSSVRPKNVNPRKKTRHQVTSGQPRHALESRSHPSRAAARPRRRDLRSPSPALPPPAAAGSSSPSPVCGSAPPLSGSPRGRQRPPRTTPPRARARQPPGAREPGRDSDSTTAGSRQPAPTSASQWPAPTTALAPRVTQ